jgi:hypothetical protein
MSWDQPNSSTLFNISGAVMTTRHERSEPGVTTINRSHPLPTGTWTIDPADSSISSAWRTLRLWTSTARLHGLGSSTLMSCHRLASFASSSHQACRS